MPQATVLLQDGRIRYIGATQATATVATPLAHHKLCHIRFSGDGVFVQSPYFQNEEGIASRIKLPVGSKPPYTLKLAEQGKVTSHLVKLSHHVDGAAHFSQDGLVKTEIRNHSFGLKGPGGLLFELFAFWLSGFELFDQKLERQDRAHIQFQSLGSHVFAVRICGMWCKRTDVEARIEPGTNSVGPLATFLDPQTGARSQVFFLGPPLESVFSSYLLVLSCNDTPMPEGVTKPRVIIIGGWAGSVQDAGVSFLACSYPVASLDELALRIGSIDLKKPMVPK